jgi:hypothetical protein
VSDKESTDVGALAHLQLSAAEEARLMLVARHHGVTPADAIHMLVRRETEALALR